MKRLFALFGMALFLVFTRFASLAAEDVPARALPVASVADTALYAYVPSDATGIFLSHTRAIQSCAIWDVLLESSPTTPSQNILAVFQKHHIAIDNLEILFAVGRHKEAMFVFVRSDATLNDFACALVEHEQTPNHPILVSDLSINGKKAKCIAPKDKTWQLYCIAWAPGVYAFTTKKKSFSADWLLSADSFLDSHSSLVRQLPPRTQNAHIAFAYTPAPDVGDSVLSVFLYTRGILVFNPDNFTLTGELVLKDNPNAKAFLAKYCTIRKNFLAKQKQLKRPPSGINKVLKGIKIQNQTFYVNITLTGKETQEAINSALLFFFSGTC